MDALDSPTSSFQYTSCGAQAESTKKTMASFSFTKATRPQQTKVFLSKKQPQDILGRDSPGFCYSPTRQSRMTDAVFGKARSRPKELEAKYPETSNDLMGNMPDSIQFKYSFENVSLDRSTRNARVNQPDLVSFARGEDSPGPARYRAEAVNYAHRHAHSPKVDWEPPKYSMRPKTKILEQESQTPAKVGPGLYSVPSSVGQQAASTNMSPPQWSVHKTERFHQAKAGMKEPNKMWDGKGEKKIQFSRILSAPPSYGFGTSTRACASRVMTVRTPLDLVK